MNDSLPHVVSRLRQARNVAILTHQRPDPDALGCQSALALILKKMNVPTVTILNFDPPPRQYAFLQEYLAPIAVLPFTPEQADSLAPTLDTIITVDTCSYQQLEPAAAWLKSQRDKVVAIDHHRSRDDIGPILYSDTSAAACAEIITQLAQSLDVTLDEPIATRLFCGLVADTGWFRFDSVTPRSHRVAADLVTAGAQPAKLYELLQQNETAPKLLLMQRALASMIYGANGKIALMSVRQSDFAQTGAVGSQTEELVNLPLMVGSVEVVAFLTEMPDGRIRASLRSKHDIDVNAICRQFQGGGHAKAAGCRLNGPLEIAQKELLQVIEKAMQIEDA